MCSTYYDRIQKEFKQQPIYIHFFIKEDFIAGVKLYVWESNKLNFILPRISRSVLQFGEYIIKVTHQKNKELKTFINSIVIEYIKSKKPVWFKSTGYYGNQDLIITPEKVKKTNFDVAVVDLSISEEQLLANFHTKQRNTLKKAIKSNLIFEINVDIEVLINLIKSTYSNQDKSGPAENYLKIVHSTLQKNDACVLVAVRQNEEYLSAGLIQKYGNKADYTFGGNKRNSLGAGQFLQWNVIKFLKENGFKEYSFGQVATELDNSNLKFTKGISNFKLRFGPNRKKCFSQKMIFNPFYYKLFNSLIKLQKYAGKR